MSTELENPGRDLAVTMRTVFLAGWRLGELYARRREMMARRASVESTDAHRKLNQRIAAEQKLAEERLRPMRNTVRALAGVDTSQIADTLETAVAWRDRSPMAAEMAEQIEGFLRTVGIDPAQLRTAAQHFARTVEPGLRPGLDLSITDSDRQLAAGAEWGEHLDTELRELAPAGLAALAERGVAGFDAALAELDRRDLEAVTAQYRRFQGAAPDDPGQMLGDWRNSEAARWAAGKQAADLALFAALVSEERAATGLQGTSSTPAQALTDLWRAWRVREQLGLPQPDLGEHSVSVFRAELDRATEWFHDNEPDYLEQWQRLRSTNPARSDQHLIRRYETEQAKQWAAEIGDDLWKHGFAAAAAKSPGTDLDEIARTVWVGAGRPQPTATIDLENTATLEQRWQQQINTVERARARAQDWHSPRLDPNIAPAQRDRRTAELVADYHQTQAELWLAEARATGTIADNVSERDPIERIFASWRSHTAGQQVLSEPSTQPTDALDRAQRWLADNDPAAFLTYQAHLEAVPEHVRDRARAELIRDHDIHHARRFAEYAEMYMGMPEGTAALPADEVLQVWRQYTEAVAAQQNPGNEAANSATASTESSRGGSTSNRTSPVSPSLAELVGEAVPEHVRENSKWLGVEQRFRRLVTAGNDPQRLADGVRSLDYTHATKPWALTVWKMDRVAVDPAEQEARPSPSSPANDADVTTTRAASEPSGLHPLVDDLLATYIEWNSPEHRDEIETRLAGMDDEAAEALKIAFLGSGTSPRGAVDDAATHSPPRVPPDIGTERSRGQSR